MRILSGRSRSLLMLLVAGWTLVACGRSGPGPDTPADATIVVVSERAVSPADAPTATSPPEQPESPAEQVSSPLADAAPKIPVYRAVVVDELPHDRDAFTQGLVYKDGHFYEGTGLRGRSSLRRVEPESGAVLSQVELDPDLFGEGITIFDDRIYQLTWKARTGFIYDLNSFEQIGNFSYASEGWGLTHDGQHLIMSDGTPFITFRDPETFEEIRRIAVHTVKGQISQLNELEYIDGLIYANIWQTDIIAISDPKDGQVVGWIDLRGILAPEEYADQPVDVLNGIAYDEAGDRLFVTGKLWPKVFQIELHPN